MNNILGLIVVFICIGIVFFLNKKIEEKSKNSKYDNPFIELKVDNILGIFKEDGYTKIILKNTIKHVIIYDDFKNRLLEEKEK